MSLPPPAYVAAFRSAPACAPEALRRESVERIAKLLPRLAVENDQELLQAARRIARELEASQIEQRNIAVGNAIREATAQAIASGQKINPVQVQKIITDYDGAHHISDPVTGQDLTQSYVLPEFQGGANMPMAAGHEQIINGIKVRRVK
ncbi:hypothetical protein [Methylocella sp.]|uniref:hypothetical protein n=1 Tax=Methylocella sp. TaxID=1978226 RepID=UPI0035B28BA5